MSGEGFTVNSDQTKDEFHALIDQHYDEHKHSVYEWVAGVDRTAPQNKMFWWLYIAIGKQLYGGDTDHARAECKLTIGVPILREGSKSFRETYDKVIKPHDYEIKLDMMKVIQVSSLMTRDQGINYINLIFDTYATKGVVWPKMVVEGKEKMK